MNHAQLWVEKDPTKETSRDRYTGEHLGRRIAEFEAALPEIGFGADYSVTIHERVTQGREDRRAQHLYRPALARTLRAK